MLAPHAFPSSPTASAPAAWLIYFSPAAPRPFSGVAVRGRRWGAASERGVVAGVAFRQREALKRNTRGPAVLGAPHVRRDGASGFLRVGKRVSALRPEVGTKVKGSVSPRVTQDDPAAAAVSLPGWPGFWRCRLLPRGLARPLCPCVGRGSGVGSGPSFSLQSSLSSVSGTSRPRRWLLFPPFPQLLFCPSALPRHFIYCPLLFS